MTEGDVSEGALVERLEAARRRRREVGWSSRDAAAAREAELDSERALAAHRGEPYAVVVDLGVRWDSGAPLPYVVANNYLLAFHDEMVEALAYGIDARLVRGTLRALMTASVDDIIGRPHRP